MEIKNYSVVTFIVVTMFVVSMLTAVIVVDGGKTKATRKVHLKHKNFETYSIDGSGNNKKETEWGRTSKPLRRLFGYHYPDTGDKFGESNWNKHANRPTCCAFETSILKTDADLDITSAQGLTICAMSFGQFASAHDIAHSPPSFQGGIDQTGFDSTKESCIGFFSRNVNQVKTDSNGQKIRLTTNTVTSLLDLHIVYGEDEVKANLLRLKKDGLLKEILYESSTHKNKKGSYKRARKGQNTRENYPPSNCPLSNIATLDFTGVMSSQLFCLGDDRGNQNRHLVILQLLFFREHNRLARQLKKKHPKWTDEMIYQKARVINIAQYQNIVFYEYLKAMIGEKQFYKLKLHKYKGYDKNVEPQVFVEFSQAVNRCPHAQIKSNLLRLGAKGQLKFTERLRSSFFVPSQVQSYDLSEYIYGMIKDTSQDIGFQIAKDVGTDPPQSNSPFPFPSFHLTAIDCLRGRELGLIDYNGARKALKLKPITSFNELTSSNFKRGILNTHYGGDSKLENIDLYVGVLAEDHLEEGSALGEVGSRIFAMQYDILRRGDRFWFENPHYKALTRREKKLIKKVKLSDIMLRNSNVKCIQEDVFHTPKFSKMKCQGKISSY